MVTLKGDNAGGIADAIQLKQVSSNPLVTLASVNTLTTSFTAPSKCGKYVFELTLTGEGGIPSTDQVTVTVVAPQAVVKADAGADHKKVIQGTSVTLDGSKSQNAAKYEWVQTKLSPAERAVTHNNANTPNPTFTFPKEFKTLTFKLTVTGVDGTTTHDDTVEISSAKGKITTVGNITQSDGRWSITGTSDIVGPGVTIDIFRGVGFNDSNPFATVLVDATGTWRYRGTTPSFNQGEKISIRSSTGGELKDLDVRIR
ncbi:hypothetical protein V7111_00610 [Neobacillus niacini]